MAVESASAQVRKIDNIGHQAPFSTILSLAFLIVLIVWFLRGGSFVLYASLFFSLYYLTKLSWLSIILVSIVQNLFFLPFRIISERFYVDLKDFEHALEKTKSDDQYFVLKNQVREGNKSVIFYIINFVLFFIAFISAGRVFFLEFYHTPIATHWLYSWVPYPQYPLQGVIFEFPLIKATSTIALDWSQIIKIWIIPILVLAVGRIIWLILKPLLYKSSSILRARISLNRIKLLLGGFVGTLFIFSLYFLRHFPTSFQVYYFTADLSRQNTTFNIITAICTCLATIYSGFEHAQEQGEQARLRGIPEDIITTVSKQTIRTSVGNGILLGLLAIWITRLMPSSHDLSVLAFEALYILYPITFGLLVPKRKPKVVEEVKPLG